MTDALRYAQAHTTLRNRTFSVLGRFLRMTSGCYVHNLHCSIANDFGKLWQLWHSHVQHNCIYLYSYPTLRNASGASGGRKMCQKMKMWWTRGHMLPKNVPRFAHKLAPPARRPQLMDAINLRLLAASLWAKRRVCELPLWGILGIVKVARWYMASEKLYSRV